MFYLLYSFACCCAVSPTVNMTPMNNSNQAISAMNCNVTIVRSIVGSVKITWAINGIAQNRSSNYTKAINSGSIIYSDILIISSESHNNTVYSCEATVNTSTPLRANDSWTLIIPGE